MRQARALLALPPRPGSAEADANAALQAAAASCDAAVDPLFASVRLRVSDGSAAADAPVRPADHIQECLLWQPVLSSGVPCTATILFFSMPLSILLNLL